MLVDDSPIWIRLLHAGGQMRVEPATVAPTDRSALHTPVDGERFRSALSCFASGVAVVTSVDGAGPCGATTTALCSVSDRPPSLLVCLNSSSRTLSGITETGGFVINVLRADREGLGRHFAGKAPDKFADVTWRRSGRFGAPVLAGDVVAHAECAVRQITALADHYIVVGLVLDAWTGGESPLLYYRREFGQFGQFGVSGDPGPADHGGVR